MKIEDFIKKNSLKQLPVSQSFVSPQLTPSVLMPENLGDTCSIFTNNDRSIWVSLNQTKKLFKILYNDMIVLASDWLDSNSDYQTSRN